MIIFCVLIPMILACQTTFSSNTLTSSSPVKLGVEVFFDQHLDLIRGKRVGLITNPTGLDRQLNSIVEQFQTHPDVKLVALYGPEHGVRGNAQAGEYVSSSYFDHVMGTSLVREKLERGEPVENMTAGFAPGLSEFSKLRTPFLLYH